MKETPHIGSPAVGCLIGKAYQILLSQLADALKKEGLEITTTEYLVLRALYCNDGIQQCEIVIMTGKDKASVCRCVSALEKKELVATESVSHKCLRVFLTNKSREMEERIMKVANMRHKALMDLSTPEEMKAFIRILEKVAATS